MVWCAEGLFLNLNKKRIMLQITHIRYEIYFVDHPYIEPRENGMPELGTAQEADSVSADASADSLHLELSVSDVEQSTCDSFVTCDGEVGRRVCSLR